MDGFIRKQIYFNSRVGYDTNGPARLTAYRAVGTNLLMSRALPLPCLVFEFKLEIFGFQKNSSLKFRVLKPGKKAWYLLPVLGTPIPTHLGTNQR